MGSERDKMYLHEGVYFSDLTELINQWSYSTDDILDLSEDFTLEATICLPKPLYEFTADNIVENIPENDIPEEGFLEYIEGIKNAVESTLDLDTLNKRVPKIWVATEGIKIFTKNDFLQTLN